MATKMIFLAIDLNDLDAIYQQVKEMDLDTLPEWEVVDIIQEFHFNKYDIDMEEADARKYMKSLRNFYFSE